MKLKQPDDRELGMHVPITRRDFMNGMLVATGAMMTPPHAFGASASTAYPPALTGLRGSHAGSFERAHALALGIAHVTDAPRVDGNYDLVVVGAGLSGLAAAYLYRQRNPAAKVLLLDTHDDFGGHAKRNEFTTNGKTIIGYGGSQSIDGPGGYSSNSKKILADLGVNTQVFYEAFDRQKYNVLGLDAGIFFDAATFGRDVLVAGDRVGGYFQSEKLPDAAYLQQFPISPAAQQDLLRLLTERRDYLSDVPALQKVEWLRHVSYLDYLRNNVRVSTELLPIFKRRTNTFWGVGYDALSALEAYRLGEPGFDGLNIDPALVDDAYEREEPYIFHFPDGNAALARLFVRQMIPQIASGNTMEDIVTAAFDYGQLDRAEHAVRIRLSTTAMRVSRVGDGVEVIYLNQPGAAKVRAKHCVLACNNAMIPYLVPQLPEDQKAALREAVRVPLVYTNVLLRNWSSFVQAGVHRVFCPGAHYQDVALDFPVSFGGYTFSRTFDDPIVVHMARAPTPGDGSRPRDQFRTGREELLNLPFETIERETRAQLTAILKPHGFDPARDILAITVNRWPHGYAYERVELFEARPAPGQAIHEIARAAFGPVTIANSDAEGRAYADAAFDAARRAVDQLV